MLPDKSEAGDRAGQDDERFNPLIPTEPKLTPRRLHRPWRSGSCAGCAAQKITSSASPWRGRCCRPGAIRSQHGRHGGAESTHARKNKSASAGRRGGDAATESFFFIVLAYDLTR